jgi:hypothetical protein
VLNELKRSEVDYLVKEEFEWATKTFSTSILGNQKFTKQSNLYSAPFTYSVEDWLDLPIPENLLKDLNSAHN